MPLRKLGKVVEKKGKALLREGLLRFLPTSGRPHAPVDRHAVHKILAVRHDARLGNLLLLTPALRLLKIAFPKAQVDVLLADKYGPALRYNPCVHDILTPRSVLGLRRRGYQLAIDFSPHHAFSLSGAAWTALSGAPRRIGYDRGDARRLLNDLIAEPTVRAHETMNLARLARHAAGDAVLPPDETLRTEWHFLSVERTRAAARWMELGLNSDSVALFVGARDEKKLDVHWFVDLARLIRDDGRSAVLMGGPAELQSLSSIKVPSGVVIAPPLPLREFAAWVACARAVVTADTGPMHLAAAVGTATVELFSHTEPWRFGYGHIPGHRMVITPARHATVEEAWSALSLLLAEAPPAPNVF